MRAICAVPPARCERTSALSSIVGWKHHDCASARELSVRRLHCVHGHRRTTHHPQCYLRRATGGTLHPDASFMFMFRNTPFSLRVLLRCMQVVDMTQFVTVPNIEQVVVLSVAIPYATSSNWQLASYKAALRHVNSHAFVNACMTAEVTASASSVTLQSQPIIAYGGVGPHAMRASNTEAFLGRKKSV